MGSLVSVVIPARNDSRALPNAVRSVLAQDGVANMEVVIAVGPSTDDTEDIAHDLQDRFEQVRVVSNPTGKTAAGLNLAIAKSRHPVIARVDARSVLPPGYLVAALETLEQTGAANVGAIQRPIGNTTVQRGIAAAMRSRLGSGGVAYRGTSHVRKADTGYLGVFRREPLLEVGGFDEDSVRNQDAELNLRLTQAGHEVWIDPRMVVAYSPRSSLATLGSQYWQYGWWRRRTIRKHPASVRARQLLPPVAVVGVLLGLAASVVWPYALIGPVLYFAALLVTAVSMHEVRLAERAIAVCALATMHFSWSFGFLASSLSLMATSSPRR